MIRIVLPALMLFLCQPLLAQDKVFSGPQPGEELEPFRMTRGFGDGVGQEIDLVTTANNGPVVIMFVHKRSRPAFGLANAVMRYCLRQEQKKLTSGICYLADDRTSTEAWMSRASRYFPQGATVGISVDGVEGPGQYGLNRNVQLTIVVANNNRVQHNFAMIQPALHHDGPKILKAIATTIGDENPIDINEYLPTNQAAQDAPIPVDPKILAQIRILRSQESSTEQIEAAIAELERIVNDKKPLQIQLGRLASQLVRSKQIESIGTGKHRETIARWAREFQPSQRMRDTPPGDQKLRELLRAVIQKDATDAEVDRAAEFVRNYLDENPAAQQEIGRISTRIINADKLQNYGTARAQSHISDWAEKYGGKN